MRRSLILSVLFLFINSALALATTPHTVLVPGNKGYVYGAPLKYKTTAQAGQAAEVIPPEPAETTGIHPIGGIIHAVKKLDAWVQRNLW